LKKASVVFVDLFNFYFLGCSYFVVISDSSTWRESRS